jgi:hypothetical protein
VLVFEELGRALVPGPLVWTHLAAGVIPGAMTGERIVGGLDRTVEPLMVEYLDAIDTLLAIDDEGIWEVDRDRLSARPTERPLDPLTPVHVAGGLLRGERMIPSWGRPPGPTLPPSCWPARLRSPTPRRRCRSMAAWASRGKSTSTCT